ncbi:MAG: methyltransferase domain-containing protein [Candidatus Malihini olakiniferum]
MMLSAPACRPTDIGCRMCCGTGYFSQRWHALDKQVIALDISPDMLQQAETEQSANVYVQSDIEHFPLANVSIDLCFNNLAVQWYEDLTRAIASCYRAIRSGSGSIFYFCEGSLGELA